MRYKYAGSVADVMVARGETTVTLIDAAGAPTARVGKVLAVPAAGVPLTVWDQESAGTRVTDLQDASGGGISDISPGADGRVTFYAPDDVVTTLWLDDGSGGPRWPVNPSELGTLLDTLADPTLYVKTGDDAANLGSGEAPAARVLTTDGAGGTSWEVGGDGGGGVSDHGDLTGRTDDDHPQYLTAARGDERYYTKALVDERIPPAQREYLVTRSGSSWLFEGQAITSRPDVPTYPNGILRVDSSLDPTVTDWPESITAVGDKWEPHGSVDPRA